MGTAAQADLVLHNADVATLAADGSGTAERARAVGIRDGRIVFVGDDEDALARRSPGATVVDLGGRLVVPGLIDSHNHFVRAGKRWSVDLHWEGARSLEQALGILRDAASRRAPGEWLTVIGGWHPDQFREHRSPTREELDASAPRHPVFVQYAYAWGILNVAAIAAIEHDLASVAQPILDAFARDSAGALTGMVSGGPAMTWVLSRLGDPDLETQVRGTVELSRELNRYGVTGVSDGGGFRSGPGSYEAIYETWRRRALTTRVRLTVHGSAAGRETADFDNYRRFTAPRFGDPMLQLLGAGEIMLYRSHDHVGAPADVSEGAFAELRDIYENLARDGWTAQTHAHSRQLLIGLLDLWETLPSAARIPDLRWAFVHADMLEAGDMERLSRLGLGILAQGQFRHSGDHAIEKLGEKVGSTPPLRAILNAGIPLGLGSDSMTAAPYNPFENLHWFLTGLTLGGQRTLNDENLLSRREALRGYTVGGAWFSFEERERGTLEPGRLADLAVLTDDYFTVPVERVPELRSELTLLGGVAVFADGPFAGLATP